MRNRMEDELNGMSEIRQPESYEGRQPLHTVAIPPVLPEGLRNALAEWRKVEQEAVVPEQVAGAGIRLAEEVVKWVEDGVQLETSSVEGYIDEVRIRKVRGGYSVDPFVEDEHVGVWPCEMDAPGVNMAAVQIILESWFHDPVEDPEPGPGKALDLIVAAVNAEIARSASIDWIEERANQASYRRGLQWAIDKIAALAKEWWRDGT